MNIVSLAPFYVKTPCGKDGRYSETQICTVQGHVVATSVSGLSFIPNDSIIPVWDAAFEGWVPEARRIPCHVETALNNLAYHQSQTQGLENPRLADWWEDQEEARAVREKVRKQEQEDQEGALRISKLLAEVLSLEDIRLLERKNWVDSYLLHGVRRLKNQA